MWYSFTLHLYKEVDIFAWHKKNKNVAEFVKFMQQNFKFLRKQVLGGLTWAFSRKNTDITIEAFKSAACEAHHAADQADQ